MSDHDEQHILARVRGILTASTSDAVRVRAALHLLEELAPPASEQPRAAPSASLPAGPKDLERAPSAQAPDELLALAARGFRALRQHLLLICVGAAQPETHRYMADHAGELAVRFEEAAIGSGDSAAPSASAVPATETKP